MRKSTILFLLIIFCGQIKSQNIFSALHLNEEREYKTERPKKIIGTNTFYNTSGKQVDKNIKTFDAAGMLLTEERYDDNNKLEARLLYTNDIVNRLLLKRVVERWTKSGYSTETAFYSYDINHFLIGTTDKDANGNVLMQSDIQCNDKGHPIQLSLYDGSGKSFGKEIATYLYDQNKVVTAVISNDGRTLSTDTIKISFINANLFLDEIITYNENGDITNSTRKNLNGSLTIFEGEFKYDQVGNCIEKKLYKVTVNNKGKRKRKIDRVFNKEYFY